MPKIAGIDVKDIKTNIQTLEERASTPTTPTAGEKDFYAKDDDKVYTLNSAGQEVELGAGASASKALDNLTTTAINQDLIFATGSKSLQTAIDAINTLLLKSGNSATTNTGDTNVSSGNATDVTGKNSGNINLTVGSVLGSGVRGSVNLDGLETVFVGRGLINLEDPAPNTWGAPIPALTFIPTTDSLNGWGMGIVAKGDFTTNKTHLLLVTEDQNNGTSGQSGPIYIWSGNATGTSTSNSGELSVASGNTISGESGNTVFSSGISSAGNTGDTFVGTGPAGLISGKSTLRSGNSNLATGNSGNTEISTGDSLVSGNTGNLILKTGIPVSGVRGKFIFDDGTAAVGKVWTATNVDGSGNWATSAAPLFNTEVLTLIAGDITAEAVTLSQTPLTGSITVSFNGVIQTPNKDYSLSGTSLRFGDVADAGLTTSDLDPTSGAAALITGDILVVSYSY